MILLMSRLPVGYSRSAGRRPETLGHQQSTVCARIRLWASSRLKDRRMRCSWQRRKRLDVVISQRQICVDKCPFNLSLVIIFIWVCLRNTDARIVYTQFTRTTLNSIVSVTWVNWYPQSAHEFCCDTGLIKMHKETYTLLLQDWLTLWCPLLLYGYSFKTSRAIPG